MRIRTRSLLPALCGLLAGCALFASPALASSASPAASPAAGQPFTSNATVDVTAHPLTPLNAPADQYFGRLKISNVGIRNIIHALAVEGSSPLALPMERTRIMGVDTAIYQWSDLYPRDPWLRRAMLTFAQVLVPKHDVDTTRIAELMLLRAGQEFQDPVYDRLVEQRLRSIGPTMDLDVDWSAPAVDPPSFADELPIRIR